MVRGNTLSTKDRQVVVAMTHDASGGLEVKNHESADVIVVHNNTTGHDFGIRMPQGHEITNHGRP